MLSVKQQAIDIIQQQPDDSSFKELFQELLFAQMVDAGLTDVENGNLIDNEQAYNMIRQWQK